MKSTTFHTFKRLIVDFARPYTTRMVIGVVAGILVGGSTYGFLSFSGDILAPFEKHAKGEESSAASVVPDVPPSQAASQPVKSEEDVEENSGCSPQIRQAMAIMERLGLDVPEEDEAMSFGVLIVAVIGLLFFAFVKALAAFLNHYYLRWVGAKVVQDLRNALFRGLQAQSLSFYGKCDVGQLISKCTYDTSLIEAAIAGTVADLATAPFMVLAVCAFIVRHAQRYQMFSTMSLLILVFPLCIGPIIVVGRLVKRFARRSLQKVSLLVSRMQENFTCIRVVKAYNMEVAETERFEEMNDHYFAEVIRALFAEIMMTPLMEFAAILCLCAFLVLCSFRGVTLSQIFPMGAAAVMLYRPLKQLAKINVSIQRTVAAADRLFELLDTDTSIPEAENPIKISEFTDRIIFDHVDFEYDAGGTRVLHDVCLTIPKGSVVAFVGETGSGKTTVANLLARFYDVTGGSISLDGHDLRDLEIDSLRHLIGVVTQETILFNDTIANNIAYGSPDATQEDIIEAARKANAHDFIMAEPDGYERVVGEKGFVLSGGQRQRVAIARAILRNPPILILDEATSALDTATEVLVQEAINRLMADRTVFAIAHRLSTIKHANQIVVLDSGRIIERGTHDELLTADGRYRELCDMQFS